MIKKFSQSVVGRQATWSHGFTNHAALKFAGTADAGVRAYARISNVWKSIKGAADDEINQFRPGTRTGQTNPLDGKTNPKAQIDQKDQTNPLE